MHKFYWKEDMAKIVVVERNLALEKYRPNSS